MSSFAPIDPPAGVITIIEALKDAIARFENVRHEIIRETEQLRKNGEFAGARAEQALGAARDLLAEARSLPHGLLSPTQQLLVGDFQASEGGLTHLDLLVPAAPRVRLSGPVLLQKGTVYHAFVLIRVRGGG